MTKKKDRNNKGRKKPTSVCCVCLDNFFHDVELHSFSVKTTANHGTLFCHVLPFLYDNFIRQLFLVQQTASKNDSDKGSNSHVTKVIL